jgi:DNA-binding transcriptional regulator YdaS (Cro superfamily)
MSPFERACEEAGGKAALAKAIGRSKQAINHYRKRVPAHICPLIERATGVRCEELRPDIEWGVLRKEGAA